MKVKLLCNKDGEAKGVSLKAQDFEKLVEKIEDLLDYEAVEQAKKGGGKLYTFEEIKAIIQSKP